MPHFPAVLLAAALVVVWAVLAADLEDSAVGLVALAAA